MKSHESKNGYFSWVEKATKGSSFQPLEKCCFERVLVMYGWISCKKNF